MVTTERSLADSARDQRVIAGVREWASSHYAGLIGELGYDPNNPYQWVERALLPADPDIGLARKAGIDGMGSAAYEQMVEDFRSLGAVDKVRENATKDRSVSTLFATLRLGSTEDTAMTHNALFGAADGDPEFANMNVVLANYIMAVMQFGNVAVDRVLTASGIEVRALPDKALDFIDKEDFKFINGEALPALNGLLKRGVAIHQAPAGQRARLAVTKYHELALSVPEISDGVAHTIRKKSPTVFGVPIWKKGERDAQFKVFEPRQIRTEDEVHRLMGEMVEEVNVYSDVLVVYGVPKGIRLLDQK